MKQQHPQRLQHPPRTRLLHADHDDKSDDDHHHHNGRQRQRRRQRRENWQESPPPPPPLVSHHPPHPPHSPPNLRRQPQQRQGVGWAKCFSTRGPPSLGVVASFLFSVWILLSVRALLVLPQQQQQGVIRDPGQQDDHYRAFHKRIQSPPQPHHPEDSYTTNNNHDSIPSSGTRSSNHHHHHHHKNENVLVWNEADWNHARASLKGGRASLAWLDHQHSNYSTSTLRPSSSSSNHILEVTPMMATVDRRRQHSSEPAHHTQDSTTNTSKHQTASCAIVSFVAVSPTSYIRFQVPHPPTDEAVVHPTCAICYDDNNDNHSHSRPRRRVCRPGTATFSRRQRWKSAYWHAARYEQYTHFGKHDDVRDAVPGFAWAVWCHLVIPPPPESFESYHKDHPEELGDEEDACARWPELVWQPQFRPAFRHDKTNETTNSHTTLPPPPLLENVVFTSSFTLPSRYKSPRHGAHFRVTATWPWESVLWKRNQPSRNDDDKPHSLSPPQPNNKGSTPPPHQEDHPDNHWAAAWSDDENDNDKDSLVSHRPSSTTTPPTDARHVKLVWVQGPLWQPQQQPSSSTRVTNETNNKTHPNSNNTTLVPPETLLTTTASSPYPIVVGRRFLLSLVHQATIAPNSTRLLGVVDRQARAVHDLLHTRFLPQPLTTWFPWCRPTPPPPQQHTSHNDDDKNQNNQSASFSVWRREPPELSAATGTLNLDQQCLVRGTTTRTSRNSGSTAAGTDHTAVDDDNNNKMTLRDLLHRRQVEIQVIPFPLPPSLYGTIRQMGQHAFAAWMGVRYAPDYHVVLYLDDDAIPFVVPRPPLVQDSVSTTTTTTASSGGLLQQVIYERMFATASSDNGNHHSKKLPCVNQQLLALEYAVLDPASPTTTNNLSGLLTAPLASSSRRRSQTELACVHQLVNNADLWNDIVQKCTSFVGHVVARSDSLGMLWMHNNYATAPTDLAPGTRYCPKPEEQETQPASSQQRQEPEEPDWLFPPDQLVELHLRSEPRPRRRWTHCICRLPTPIVT